jgi:pyrroline-5-carboxylate reductase
VDIDYRAKVDRAGNINVPKVGVLHVAGTEYRQLNAYLRTAISRVFRNFELNVSLGELRSIQVFVVGHARYPTLIGMGITGYTAAEGISFNQILQIERLLNSSGRAVYLEDENLLDSVTALSGSGPAYFYYIVDAMIKAGIKMGIDENLSKLFVKQTMIGAYHLINNSDKNLDELIKEVASKGGTTEAALKVFNENSLKEILENGILSAENRAKELNG